MILWNINEGLHRLNILYENQAIFKVKQMVSNRSLTKFNVDLQIIFEITLLIPNVHKQSTKKKRNRRKSASSSPKQPKLNQNESMTESDKMVLLQMYDGQTVLAQIVGPAKEQHKQSKMDKFALMDVNDDSYVNIDNLDKESNFVNNMKFVGNKNENVHVNEKKESENKENERNTKQDKETNQLQLFHSKQIRENIVRLIKTHNNDDDDDLFNYYNIGKYIGEYLDVILNDENIVVVVSETNKQPQVSYVSQKEYELKVRDILGKDVFIYRAMDHIEFQQAKQQYSTTEFQQIVVNLSKIYHNTAEIATELDNIYGAGCHVAKASHNKCRE